MNFNEEEPFKAIYHGANPLDLRHLIAVLPEFRPVEWHMNDDGSLENGPTIAIVMARPAQDNLVYVYGQLSMKMLNDALAKIGYKLVHSIGETRRSWTLDEIHDAIEHSVLGTFADMEREGEPVPANRQLIIEDFKSRMTRALR